MQRLKYWAIGSLFLAFLGGCGNAAPAPTPSSQNAVSDSSNAAHPTGSQAKTKTSTKTSTMAWPTVSVQTAGQLPLGVVGNALAFDSKGDLASVGGYTGVYSVRDVNLVEPTARRLALLPVPTHDAAAGFLGPDLYVFGGGQSASYNTIVRIHNGAAAVVAYLKRPLSDAVCVPYRDQGRDGLLLTGGYDGQVFKRTVQFVSLVNGKLTFTNLFALPVGLRYPAVAAVGNQVFIAGGKEASGQLSHQIYSWNGTGAQAHPAGRLPIGLEKAALYADSQYLVLVGGKDPAGKSLSAIDAIQRSTGKVRRIGTLPKPLADFGSAQHGHRLVIAGGTTGSGQSVNTEVYTVVVS